MAPSDTLLLHRPFDTDTEESPLLHDVLRKQQPHQQVPKVSDEDDKNSELLGYALMALTSFFFGSSNLLIHWAEAETGFPAISTVFVRAVVHTTLGLAYLLPFRSIRNSVTSMPRRTTMLILFRGIIGSFDLVCLYSSFNFIPVGDATTIFFLCPTFTLLLSHFLLHEPITSLDMGAVALSLCGGIIVTRPDAPLVESASSVTTRMLGCSLAAAAATLAAASYTTIRSLGLSFNFMTSVVSLAFFSLVVSSTMGGALTPGALLAYGNSGVAVAVAALFSFLAQITLTTGLQRCKAGRGVLVNTLEVPYSYSLGLLFMGETLSMVRSFGALMVMTAVALIGLGHVMKRRQ